MAAAPRDATRPVAGSYDAPYRQLADAKADLYGIPRTLFRALVGKESGWDQDARSSAGAIGLTQLMPGTARGLDVDPYDAEDNLEGGARYLSQQYDTFGDWELALAAYNAGPAAVSKYKGVPPYRETQAYVKAVLAAAGDFADTVTAKFEDWVKAGEGVDLEQVNASLLGKLFLLGAYLGKPVTAISGWRSDEEQQRIFDSGTRPAATPIAYGGEGSNHTRGGAVDATVDGEPIAYAVDAATLKMFGLKSIGGSVDYDPGHVEEVDRADDPLLADLQVRAGVVGAGPAKALLAAGALLKVAPKIAAKVGRLLKGIGKGGAKAAGSTLGATGIIGATLVALGVTGAIDLKRGLLWLLFTLLGLALVLLGVLRLVGLKAGTVVNVARGAKEA